MGMGGGSGRGKVQSDINVTPLIDVCLVLLTIFMVITPMLQKGAPVALPRTDSPHKKEEKERGQMLVSIDRNKSIFVDTDPYPEERFKTLLRDEKDRNANLEILLKGDRNLTYGDVLKVMRMFNEVDISGVALISEKIKQGGPD